MTARRVFTIGHSTTDVDTFVGLLGEHGIEAVADVRSVPHSRFSPQFNRDALRRKLNRRRIDYVFLGSELGARSSDPASYVHGKVQYERLAEAAAYKSGIDRLVRGAEAHTIAVMCTEKDPVDCHRTLLVSKSLEAEGLTVGHIRHDGPVESHADVLLRIRRLHGLDEPDLFSTEDELLAEAVRRQESQIAYVIPSQGEELS